jgi:hypothetical protein
MGSVVTVLRRHALPGALLLASCLGAAACAGDVSAADPAQADPKRPGGGDRAGAAGGGGAGGSGAGLGGGSADGKVAGGVCAPRRPAWQASLRTVHQVRTIVEQVFGPAAAADGQVQSLLATLPSDLRAKGFDTESKIVSPQHVDAYIRLAGRLAALAAAQPEVRGALEAFAGQPCAKTTDLDAGCGLDLAHKLAAAVWAQPAAERSADVDALVAVYKANKGKYQAPRAYAGFVASLLLSARSGLRLDSAERGATGKVDAQALGARLATTLTSGLPDAPLRAKMKDGSILQEPVLRAEAKRLLRTPQGRATLSHFAQQWLNVALVKSPPGRTGFVASDEQSALVAEAAREEVGKLFEHAVLDGGKSLEGFYAGDEVVPAHDWLAKLYGTPRGEGVARAAAPGRRGLLTRAAFHLHGAFADYLPLAHRGYGVKVTMLCGTIGAFPDSVDTSLPASAPDVLSSRQYFETLTEQGVCMSCHADMNPWSYPLSAYSVTGELLARESVRNRKTGQMVQVDVRPTTALPLDGATVTVADAGEMSAAIGRSREARACFAARLDQFAVGVPDGGHCGVQAASDALGAGKGTLEDAILAYVNSAAFAMR